MYLNFHPENRYNRPCVADKDMNPGILIKIKTKTNSNQETLIDYDVLGVATMNFKFNRKFIIISLNFKNNIFF